MSLYTPNLAGYAMREELSRGRLHAESEHPYRQLYQRDRDRIIHSMAFRRLEYKTQVFVNHEGDFYRTRLTHTFEVAQISRTLARVLGLNEDLAEAVALAHDLGHTPFGHAGEEALDRLMREHGGFEHNLQGLRVVDLLESRYSSFPGLNLSYEVRESFVRHHTVHDAPTTPEEFRSGDGALLEVQATIVADEIAYDNHDIDDGLYSGILNEEQLLDLALWRKAVETAGKDYRALDPHLRRAEGVRRLINLLVTDVLDNTRRNLAELNIKTLEDVRACKRQIICPSPEILPLKEELERYLSERFYKHYRVLRMAEKCKRFLTEMFLTYIDDPRILPPKHQQRIDSEGVERAVADYIAGMTDRYAEQEYQKMFHPFIKS